MNSRFDERLEERTRIAREFHDTLLQTIQARKLVAGNALHDPDPSVARSTLEPFRWLSEAGREGRAALSYPRESTTERNDLAEGLRRAGDERRLQRSIEFDLTVEGIQQRDAPDRAEGVRGRLGPASLRITAAKSAQLLILAVLTPTGLCGFACILHPRTSSVNVRSNCEIFRLS